MAQVITSSTPIHQRSRSATGAARALNTRSCVHVPMFSTEPTRRPEVKHPLLSDSSCTPLPARATHRRCFAAPQLCLSRHRCRFVLLLPSRRLLLSVSSTGISPPGAARPGTGRHYRAYIPPAAGKPLSADSPRTPPKHYYSTTVLHQHNTVSNRRHDRQCLRAKDHRSPADPAAPAQRVFPPAGFYQSPTTRTGIRPVFPAAVTRPPSNSAVSSAAPWPAPSVLAPHVPPVPPDPLKRPKRKKGPRKQTLCLFPGVFSIGDAFRSPGRVSLQFQLSLTAAPAWRLSYRPRSRWSARRSPGSPTYR